MYFLLTFQSYPTAQMPAQYMQQAAAYPYSAYAYTNPQQAATTGKYNEQNFFLFFFFKTMLLVVPTLSSIHISSYVVIILNFWNILNPIWILLKHPQLIDTDFSKFEVFFNSSLST